MAATEACSGTISGEELAAAPMTNQAWSGKCCRIGHVVGREEAADWNQGHCCWLNYLKGNEQHNTLVYIISPS